MNVNVPSYTIQNGVLKVEPNQETCILRVNIGDGTQQFLELPTVQALSYGLNVEAAPVVMQKYIKPKPEPTKVNEISHSSIRELLQSPEFVDPDNIIAQAPTKPAPVLKSKIPEMKLKLPNNSVVYKIIKPEELNLKPLVHVPRGRPKKRAIEETVTVPTQKSKPTVAEKASASNSFRTRSGRITRPPKHIEKDFETIVIKDEKFNSDLTTTEFMPLKTNNKNVAVQPLLELVHERKKRILANEHRCPVCKKMYLGRRMIRHLQKYPDHGPPKDTKKKEDSEAWKFLVDLALQCKVGQRALKFCKELVNVIKNARTLAKFMFRPSTKGKEDFHVDETMGKTLGLKPGAYTLNEKELAKDLSIYAYLDLNFFDDWPKTEKKTEETITRSTESSSTATSNQNSKVAEGGFMQLLDITGIKKENTTFIKDITNFSSFKVNNSSMSSPKHELIDQNSIEPNLFTSDSSLSSDKPMSEDENIAVEASPNFNNHIIDFMDLTNNETLNKESVMMSTNIITQKKECTKVVDNKNGHAMDVEENEESNSIEPQKQIDKEISSQANLIPDVLLLPDVDAGNVSNMLDMSTNSDDIMNVDQFVNERFKNITGLPNATTNVPIVTSLSFDSIDLFQFHGT